MKIIAKTNGGYLVDITDEEIDSFLKQDDPRNKKNYKYKYDFPIGTEIGIGAALHNLDVIKGLTLDTTRHYLTNAEKEIKDLIQKLDKVTPDFEGEKTKIKINQK